MSPDLLAAEEIQTGQHPQAAVIWLHGLGADGHDFVPIVQQLNLQGLGAIRFIFPHAPTMPVTINGGYVMRAWYDILTNDLSRREDELSLRASQKKIDALIEHEHARGIPYGKIVLAGFSQGCAMALMSGLRFPHALAGMIGLSGYLPLMQTTASERHMANADTPIFLAHGKQDPVISHQHALASRETLETLGYRVTWRDYPMEHSVCVEEIAELNEFLRGILLAN